MPRNHFFNSRFAALLLVASMLFSCKNDIPINAKWKEIIVVYGLLDPTDSVQFIRVEKAYLDEKTGALQTAKISDSLYLDSAQVSIIRLDSAWGANLDKVYYQPKLAGIFGNDKNPLYRLGQAIQGDKPYQITVRSLRTGQVITASTRTLKPALITAPFKNSTYKFSLLNENIPVEFLPRENSYSYDVSMEVVYDEFSKSDTNTKTTKTAVWQILKNSYVNPNELKRVQVPRLAFIQFLGSNLTNDTSLYHRLKYVNMLYYGGNQTITDYISVNQPSIGIVQKSAEYTNIQGGYGIFASRCFQPIRNVKFDPAAIFYIQNHPETQKLNLRP